MKSKAIQFLLAPFSSKEGNIILLMSCLMFCIVAIQSILVDIKDTVVITSPGGGAESLYFAKGICTNFFAILFILLYSKLSNHFNYKHLFHGIVTFFLFFFLLYALIALPYAENLHMSVDTITAYQELYPKLKWCIPLIGNWTCALFYVFADLWGPIIISLLFWQFANIVAKSYNAKYFYGLFGLAGNLGYILSGLIVKYLISGIQQFESLHNGWNTTLQILISFILLMGVSLMIIFYRLNKAIQANMQDHNIQTHLHAKNKLSLRESIRHILRSPQLGYIALLVISYGLTIHLFEAIWKKQLFSLYRTPEEYSTIMAHLSMLMGSLTIIGSLAATYLLRILRWHVSALITPLIFLFGIGTFFVITTITEFMFKDYDLILFSVYFALIAQALSKAAKFSIFDPTKEMVYVSLDPESRSKGKAIVDVLGSLGGDTGGVYIPILIVTLSSFTILHSVPLIALIFFATVSLWIWAIFKLKNQVDIH